MGNYLNKFCGGSYSHEELRTTYNGPRTRPVDKFKGPVSTQTRVQVQCRGWVYVLRYDKEL